MSVLPTYQPISLARKNMQAMMRQMLLHKLPRAAHKLMNTPDTEHMYWYEANNYLEESGSHLPMKVKLRLELELEKHYSSWYQSEGAAFRAGKAPRFTLEMDWASC